MTCNKPGWKHKGELEEKTVGPSVSGSPAPPQIYKLHTFTVGPWPWNSHLVLQGNKRTYWKQMYGHPDTPWLTHTDGFLNRPTGHTAWFQRRQESQSWMASPGLQARIWFVLHVPEFCHLLSHQNKSSSEHLLRLNGYELLWWCLDYHFHITLTIHVLQYVHMQYMGPRQLGPCTACAQLLSLLSGNQHQKGRLFELVRPVRQVQSRVSLQHLHCVCDQLTFHLKLRCVSCCLCSTCVVQ